MAETLVWRCDLCGSTLPGPGLELATVECRCGVGKGNWRVARARIDESGAEVARVQSPAADVWPEELGGEA